MGYIFFFNHVPITFDHRNNAGTQSYRLQDILCLIGFRHTVYNIFKPCYNVPQFLCTYNSFCCISGINFLTSAGISDSWYPSLIPKYSFSLTRLASALSTSVSDPISPSSNSTLNHVPTGVVKSHIWGNHC